MKSITLLLLVLTLSPILSARTVEVRPGGTYTNLEAAAAVAAPGDTILFRAGTYAGGEHVSGLQGTHDAWITIMAAPGEEVVLRGGSSAWQLSDPAWIRISGFVLEGQTSNGMNIDDAASYDTPAHHIVIERCTWRGINASGNNDLLKLSGVDSFEVRDCIFLDGAAGGSMIDMVGCHNGSFTGNRFERGGSNSIQAKGGTRYIRIERNTFIDGGQRTLNIGGSTGLEFFRPLGVNYESSDIHVYSNTFVGSDAPIAFVGTVNSTVVNNTIWLPRRWAIRILQETDDPPFLQCGDNTFRNNIVVVGNAAANPTINIGGNTRPQTFTFSNNLWYNAENAGWNGPNLPVAESGGIIGSNPMLAAPPGTMTPGSGSPAIGNGYAVTEPLRDYLGQLFATPRSIGAIEGNAPTVSVERNGSANGSARGRLRLTPEYGSQSLMAGATLHHDGVIEVMLYDMRGTRCWSYREHHAAGEVAVRIPLNELPAGAYLCVLLCDGASLTQVVGRQ